MTMNSVCIEKIGRKDKNHRLKAMIKKANQLERDIVFAQSQGNYAHMQHLEYALNKLNKEIEYISR